MGKIGKYEIVREVGKGAMGRVYRATDPHVGRTVALKVTLWSGDEDKEEREARRAQLLRDARNAGRLSHHHIVTVYEFEEDGDQAFIVMEFVEGTTLKAVLEKAKAERNSLPAEQLVRYISQAAEALDYAHRNGVVHRDIKPGNIMISQDDAVKIADFGISKNLNTGDRTKTQVGLVSGTPEYMSREQVQGKSTDGRTDQYSLAVVAYEMLTGGVPFPDNPDQGPFALIYKIAFDDPPSPNC